MLELLYVAALVPVRAGSGHGRRLAMTPVVTDPETDRRVVRRLIRHLTPDELAALVEMPGCPVWAASDVLDEIETRVTA